MPATSAARGRLPAPWPRAFGGAAGLFTTATNGARQRFRRGPCLFQQTSRPIRRELTRVVPLMIIRRGRQRHQHRRHPQGRHFCQERGAGTADTYRGRAQSHIHRVKERQDDRRQPRSRVSCLHGLHIVCAGQMDPLHFGRPLGQHRQSRPHGVIQTARALAAPTTSATGRSDAIPKSTAGSSATAARVRPPRTRIAPACRHQGTRAAQAMARSGKADEGLIHHAGQ